MGALYQYGWLNDHLTWVWASWLLDVNPVVVKVWLVTIVWLIAVLGLNNHLTWVWASGLLDVNPVVVKVWLVTICMVDTIYEILNRVERSPDVNLSIWAPWCKSGNPVAAFLAPQHWLEVCKMSNASDITKFHQKIWAHWHCINNKKNIGLLFWEHVLYLQVRITSVLVTSPRLNSCGCRGTEIWPYLKLLRPKVWEYYLRA